MALAVTHVLLTIIVVGLWRDYVTKHKRYFTLHTLLVAGVAGLLPDIDIPIGWILGFFGKSYELLVHGGITHSALFGLIFLIPGFIFWYKKKHKIAVYFFVICFGILFHLFLDCITGGYYHFFWPFYIGNHCITIIKQEFLAGLDAIILLAWLYHEEVKHRISDFI